MKNYLTFLSAFFILMSCNNDDFSKELTEAQKLNEEIEAYQVYLAELKTDSVAQSFELAKVVGKEIQSNLDEQKAEQNKKAVMFLDQNLCILKTLPKFDAKANGLNRDLDTIQVRLDRLNADVNSKAIYAYDSIAEREKISMPELVQSFIDEERLHFNEKKKKFEKRIIALNSCSDAFYAQKDSINYYLNLITN